MLLFKLFGTQTWQKLLIIDINSVLMLETLVFFLTCRTLALPLFCFTLSNVIFPVFHPFAWLSSAQYKEVLIVV